MPPVAFSPDGTYIVTSCDDKTARVWDAATGQEKVVLKGYTSDIKSVAFSSDGMRVVTTSENNDAQVWNAESGREMKPAERPKPPLKIAPPSVEKKK